MRVSYTLRDAQYVCWKTFKKLGGTQTSNSLVADLIEEASRVGKTLNDQSQTEAKQALAAELSNVIYTAFVLAEQYGVNLEEVFLQNVNDKILSNLP